MKEKSKGKDAQRFYNNQLGFNYFQFRKKLIICIYRFCFILEQSCKNSEISMSTWKELLVYEVKTVSRERWSVQAKIHAPSIFDSKTVAEMQKMLSQALSRQNTMVNSNPKQRNISATYDRKMQTANIERRLLSGSERTFSSQASANRRRGLTSVSDTSD